MTTYLELFDDIKATIQYSFNNGVSTLDTEYIMDVITEMSKIHEVQLSYGEIDTFLKNLQDEYGNKINTKK
jgi:hypothetical protein